MYYTKAVIILETCVSKRKIEAQACIAFSPKRLIVTYINIIVIYKFSIQPALIRKHTNRKENN